MIASPPLPSARCSLHFQMPASDEPQDSGGPEESKGNLESPKQGSSKMKLKSRLSGEWNSLPDVACLKVSF